MVNFVRVQFAPSENGAPYALVPIESQITGPSRSAVNSVPSRVGTCHSKAEVLAIFGEVMSKVSGPPVYKVRKGLPSGDTTVVEMFFQAVAKNGWHFEQNFIGDESISTQMGKRDGWGSETIIRICV